MDENGKMMSLIDSIPERSREDARNAFLEVLRGSRSKWKDSCNQVLFESPGKFYKMYEDRLSDGWFLAQIRERLAEAYRDLGADWEVYTVVDWEKKLVYQLEARGKLREVQEGEIPFRSLLGNWSRTLESLEDRLGIGRLCRQMRRHFPNLEKIKLVRECTNKYADYAWIGDRIVLLDDTDFFLAMVSREGDWMSVSANAYDVATPAGFAYFAPRSFFSDRSVQEKLDSVDNVYNRWFLFDPSTCKVQMKDLKELRSLREEMFLSNIRILSGFGDDVKRVMYTDSGHGIREEGKSTKKND